jgi:hypothetical protein
MPLLCAASWPAGNCSKQVNNDASPRCSIVAGAFSLLWFLAHVRVKLRLENTSCEILVSARHLWARQRRDPPGHIRAVRTRTDTTLDLLADDLNPGWHLHLGAKQLVKAATFKIGDRGKPDVARVGYPLRCATKPPGRWTNSTDPNRSQQKPTKADTPRQGVPGDPGQEGHSPA